ncbi:diguanylate cyclase (GGDEF)-like protein [Fluviicoccus keumensis]|uniref:diguanylate cyclase n=1 Tax=Fluviicoccus keumensis TaxID=1435465 RepID=A0A4Q7YLY4_9GAMM|nr:diguanylate cyclase [Fluviicoccus keumensis]RZU38318.1 diguanylate cyclase (GGDEF)-like protein [Fluviicoccus keumensis]
MDNAETIKAEPQGVALPQLFNAKKLEYIQDTLKHRPFFLYFENDIETMFYAKRADEYLRILMAGKSMLLMLFGLIAYFAVSQFPNALFANDLFLVKFCFLPIALTLMCVMVFAEKPFFVRNFQWMAAPTSTIILTCILLASLSNYDKHFSQHAAYDVIIITTIVCFGIRVLFPVCVMIVIIAGSITMLATVMLNWSFDILKLSHYYGLGSMTTLVIVGLMERQERLAFLQELLVSHQTVELDRLNRALDRMAREDPLTGLVNRRGFDETMQIEWDRARRDNQSLALLYMDIDFFKLYNDTYGHNIGDVCLRRVAQTVKGALRRPADLAGRYGGEEFVVLLPNTDREGAVDVAIRILKHVDALALPHSRSKAASHVTLSIGISQLVPGNGNSLKEFLKRADDALYEAKERGRHQYFLSTR